MSVVTAEIQNPIPECYSPQVSRTTDWAAKEIKEDITGITYTWNPTAGTGDHGHIHEGTQNR
jgi:hypothetical protein